MLSPVGLPLRADARDCSRKVKATPPRMAVPIATFPANGRETSAGERVTVAK